MFGVGTSVRTGGGPGFVTRLCLLGLLPLSSSGPGAQRPARSRNRSRGLAGPRCRRGPRRRRNDRFRRRGIQQDRLTVTPSRARPSDCGDHPTGTGAATLPVSTAAGSSATYSLSMASASGERLASSSTRAPKSRQGSKRATRSSSRRQIPAPSLTSGWQSVGTSSCTRQARAAKCGSSALLRPTGLRATSGRGG